MDEIPVRWKGIGHILLPEQFFSDSHLSLGWRQTMWHNVSLDVSFIIRQGDYTEYDSKQYIYIFFFKICV